MNANADLLGRLREMRADRAAVVADMNKAAGKFRDRLEQDVATLSEAITALSSDTGKEDGAKVDGNNGRPMLRCPVCDSPGQFTQPYLPPEVFVRRKPVAHTIMSNAIAQFFSWHPRHATPWAISLWLEGKSLDAVHGDDVLRGRVIRACRQMVRDDELDPTFDEAHTPDGDMIRARMYTWVHPAERFARKARRAARSTTHGNTEKKE